MKYFWFILIVLNNIAATATDNESINSRERFNDNWRFKRFGTHPEKPGKTIEEPKSLESAQYNDDTWRPLNVPHDWGIEGPFRDDLENNTGLLPWKGIGWYRKHFTITKKDIGKQIFVEFDGVMANAKVWLNGQHVGEWPYGYSSFRFNLTPFITYDKKNFIAVRVDTENLGSRWYPGAGIYRNVWLSKTNSTHIDYRGIYLTTPTISDKEASVNMLVNLKNSNNKAAYVTVNTIIQNHKKKNVAESKALFVTIPALSTHSLRLETTVKNPVLWDIETPVLYTAITQITNKHNIIHEEKTVFGFRTIAFTTDKGFLLNGKRVEIKGVCNHHDLGPLGAAFHTPAAERQLKILKEMGCNSVRTSHNPPAPELLDLCDKMGFLVQVEAFDTWEKEKKKNDYNIDFKEWHVEDLKAMVLRDRNHPSVFMWSIGNEVPDQDNPELAKELTAIIHQLDPSRPATSGCNNRKAGFNGFQKSIDVFGYNYRLDTYKKFFDDTANRAIPFISNETSSCLSSRGEYFFPVQGGSVHENLPETGICHVSSYDLQHPVWGNTPDEQFKIIQQFPRVMGEYVWTGFDYLGEPTPYGVDKTYFAAYPDSAEVAKLKNRMKKWGTPTDEYGDREVPSRSSYFGIMDLCGFKKNRFYMYQAEWKPDFPMAHILPHWNWPERVGKNVPVHLYTSGDEAELFLNGKSLGKRKKNKFDYRLQWDTVTFQPGELKVMVWKNGKKWASASRKTTSKPAKIRLTADKKRICIDGENLVFITADIVDKNGLLVPRSSNMVNFKIDGPGAIIAVGNGDPTCHEPFIAEKHSAFNGKCLAVVKCTKASGSIKLTAQSKGLSKSAVTIKVIK